MKTRIKRIWNNFLNIIKLPEMKVLPGHLAFYILLSFIPILAICTAIASALMNNFNLVTELKGLLPKALFDIVVPLLNNGVPNVNLFLLIFCYLIVGTNGPASIIITSNELYKIKAQTFLQVRLKAFIMTIIVIALFLFMIFIPIFGDTIVNFIFEWLKRPTYLYNYVGVYKFLKVFISFLFIYFTIKLLYTMAPNEKIKSRTTTMGSLFTTFGWIISTEIFAFYITKIAKYNLLYGNFANILILLIWINFLSYLFMIGMAINVNSYSNGKSKEVEVKE